MSGSSTLNFNRKSSITFKELREKNVILRIQQGTGPMPLEQDMPELANAIRPAQAMACQCPLGKAGVDWSMPTKQDRPGPVNVPRAGQAWSCQCQWERTGLDSSMSTGQGMPGLVISPRTGKVWTYQCPWGRTAWTSQCPWGGAALELSMFMWQDRPRIAWADPALRPR